MANHKSISKGVAIVAAAALIALVSGQLFAQRGPGRGPGMGMCPGMGGGPHGFAHLDRMQKELGLTDAQVKKIFDIGTEYRQKYFDNRGNRDKVMALHEEHRKAVESVLTKEQKEKYDKLFKDGRMRGKGPGKGMGRGR